MFPEKAQQFSRRIWPRWVREGAIGTATGPGVTGAMNHPALYQRPATRILITRAGVSAPAPRLASVQHLARGVRRPGPESDELLGVARMDRFILIPVKEDQWDSSARQTGPGGATRPVHGLKGRWQIV